MFAGCLLKGSAADQLLVKKCSNRLHTVQLDVTDKQQVQKAAETVQQKLGKNSEYYTHKNFPNLDPKRSGQALSMNIILGLPR